MIVNLSYLNKLIDQYNNLYHCFIGKKVIDVDYSALIESIESIYKPLKFKIGDRVRITKHNNIFSKGYTKNW